MLLEISGLSVDYGAGLVLKDVSLSVGAAEVLGIVGESGSGKTTLLRAAAGLLPPKGRLLAGSVKLEGRELTTLSERERRAFRGPGIGWIAQDAGASFCPIRTVGEQMFEAVRAHAWEAEPVFRRRASAVLDALGLDDPERLLQSLPCELSGGMSQRAGIAAALLIGPRVLLADEPTSALDADASRRALGVMRRYCGQHGAALVLVSHDMGAVSRAADRLAVMHEGCVIESGSARRVIGQPSHPYTRELIEATPRLRRASS